MRITSPAQPPSNGAYAAEVLLASAGRALDRDWPGVVDRVAADATLRTELGGRRPHDWMLIAMRR